MRCYCCSSKPFKTCCEPFIKGIEFPSSAEQLMRSRFSAYATAHYQYILETYTKEKQQGLSIENLAQSAQGATWFALQVHPAFADSSVHGNAKVEAADEADSHSKPITAIVEFTAYYFENKNMYQLHESSNFIVEEGKWRYHDGELHNDCGRIKYGRNLPCVCGSNKKFKQCCGLKNH